MTVRSFGPGIAVPLQKGTELYLMRGTVEVSREYLRDGAGPRGKGVHIGLQQFVDFGPELCDLFKRERLAAVHAKERKNYKGQ